MNCFSLRHILAGLILLPFMFSTKATAAPLLYSLDIFYDMPQALGDPTPSNLGAPYWLQAHFEDLGNTSSGDSLVKLTLSAPGLAGTEFVSAWLFNINVADYSISSIAFSDVVGEGTAGLKYSSVEFYPDKVTPTLQGYKFDLAIGYATKNSPGNIRFIGGFADSILLKGKNLSALAFMSSMNVKIGDVYYDVYSKAHVQSLTGGDSTWLVGFDDPPTPVASTPEPGTMLLLGIGLAGAAFITRRRKTISQ